jgi:23S rRNA pseudouridine1911/1915/1917 synthase
MISTPTSRSTLSSYEPKKKTKTTSITDKLVFVADAAHPRSRLDKLVVHGLAERGRSESRATVQRWIERGRVLVDGQAQRASAAVRAGARIDVEPEPPAPTTALPDASIDVRVVYEDAFLLVVDKPAGLVVHPARGHASGTLVNALLGRGGFERASADPRDPEGYLRPGIVHRIDKGTSGLLVVAKDAPTREALKQLFAAHAIEREYRALVVGTAKDEIIATLHGRHPTSRLRFTTRVERGRRAITRVRLLEALGPASLVACQLETGRTHQIRVHLAERAATPILGDPLYGAPPKNPILRQLATELGHQALHAAVLGFTHPATGQPMRWEAPLPHDLAQALATLRAAK